MKITAAAIQAGKYRKRRAAKANMFYSLGNPNTCGNPHPSKFACDVRKGGWLVDRRMFDDPEAAADWGRHHNGQMSTAVASLYVSIETEKAREAGRTS
jgi:hypothetical protein